MLEPLGDEHANGRVAGRVAPVRHFIDEV